MDDSTDKKAKPFVKWAGGKRSLLPKIIPASPAKFNAYYEPFVGGGAVFFALSEKAHGGTIGDINDELLATYRVIRNEPDKLIKSLKEHKSKHFKWLKKNNDELNKKLDKFELSKGDYIILKKAAKEKPLGNSLIDALGEINDKNKTSLKVADIERLVETKRISKEEKEKIYFYQVRNESPVKEIDIASRFIYLNRTCFNGLHRVNSQGKFNVPLGDYENPDIVREKQVKAASKALNHIDQIIHGDFHEINPKKGDFVYFDPPYDVLNASSFTQYAQEDFSRYDQKRLRDFTIDLTKRGVKVMLSNHDTAFIRWLYKDFYIYKIQVNRPINAQGSGRGKVGEVLITNYVPPEAPVMDNGSIGLISKADLKEAKEALQEEISVLRKNSSESKDAYDNLASLISDVLKGK